MVSNEPNGWKECGVKGAIGLVVVRGAGILDLTRGLPSRSEALSYSFRI